MSHWKKGNTNKLDINQILLGFFLGGCLDFLINKNYLIVALCAVVAFLNYYIARHKSPK